MIESTVNELQKYREGHHQEKAFNDPKIDEMIIFDKSSFHEDQSIYEAARVLIKDSQSGYPVVNSKGEIVGFLSEKDCLSHVFDDLMNRIPLGSVKDYMSRDIITLTPSTPFFKVLECFVTKPFHVYPIVENKKYIGFVRRKDILKHVIGMYKKI